MKLEIDLKDYPEGGSVFHRTAARGIARQGNLYLFVTNKFGDYKFPGGGVEPGETLEAALCREMLEETGYTVLEGSLREYGLVNERRKGITADILEMDSYYFFCEVQESTAALSLDDYEAEEEFRPVWLPLAEALEKNRRLVEDKKNPWVLREIGVEECLLEES